MLTFQLLSLFLRADIIVKSVIIILIVCSVFSWAIIFEKLNCSKKSIKVQRNLNKFWKSKSAETFYNNLPANSDDPMTNLFKNSMEVMLKSKEVLTLMKKCPEC